MKTLVKSLGGIAAAVILSLAAMPAAQAAAVAPEMTVSSPTGYAPLASPPIGAEGPALKEHKAKLVKVARRRWRRRRGRRIGAAIGAAIVGGLIINEIARSNRRYYDEPAYYYSGPRRRVSCRTLLRRCERGNSRACYRFDRRCY